MFLARVAARLAVVIIIAITFVGVAMVWVGPLLFVVWASSFCLAGSLASWRTRPTCFRLVAFVVVVVSVGVAACGVSIAVVVVPGPLVVTVDVVVVVQHARHLLVLLLDAEEECVVRFGQSFQAFTICSCCESQVFE